MGLTDLIFKKVKASVAVQDPTTGIPLPGILEFDASVSETHIDEAEITSHPVENGSEVSDHIRKLPVTLEINGVVTNSPLIFLASVQASSPVKGDFARIQDRVKRAYDYLREIQENGDLVTIVTSLREYPNMAISAISVLRDANNGNILNCTLSLREVIIAGSESVDLPLPNDSANKAKKNQGKKKKKGGSQKQNEKVPDSELTRLTGIGA